MSLQRTSSNGHAIGRKSAGTPFQDSLRSWARTWTECSDDMLHVLNGRIDAPMLTSSLVTQEMNFCRRFERIERSRISLSECSSSP